MVLETLVSIPVLVADIGILLLAGLIVLEKQGRYDLNSGRTAALTRWIDRWHRELAFVIVAGASLGSLVLSNIVGWAPCELCWYQRIFMYPVAIILGVAIALDRQDVRDYVLALAMIGGTISIYHYLVQLLQVESNCSLTAVSCTSRYINGLGFVTIPLMSLTVFAAVGLLLYRFGPSSAGR